MEGMNVPIYEYRQTARVCLAQGNIVALNVRVGFNAWGHTLGFRIWPLMPVDNAMNWNWVCLLWWNSDQTSVYLCMCEWVRICFESKISIAHTYSRERKCVHFEMKLWTKLLKITKRIEKMSATTARLTVCIYIYICFGHGFRFMNKFPLYYEWYSLLWSIASNFLFSFVLYGAGCIVFESVNW